jgi:DNA-binding CsgD family transcriptional regulator
VGAVERRISGWVDLVGDLMSRPSARFPHREISDHLHETNGCQVSWNWMDPPGRAGFELHRPISGWPTAEIRDDLANALVHHPVMRWYVVTGDLSPMSVRRVPAAVVTARGRQVVRDYLVPIGMEEQLVIPYRFAADQHRAFVLARGGEDFSAEDLRVAVAAQPLLMLLDRQIAARGSEPTADGHDLTGRELSVLQLLARGHTAAGIGARTVHRHLQGVYRKLGARDRVTAVLAARESGLVCAPENERQPASARRASSS